MSEVIIDLGTSKDARVFEPKQLIHRNEFEAAIKLIEESLQKASNDQSKKTDYAHETITILGTRGSGKTSFLLSLLAVLDYDNSPYCVLDPIDPTLIEEKGHMFLTVVSAIKKQVDTKYKDIEEDDQYSRWKKSLDKLAQGIPTVDGVGGTLLENNWQDPMYVLETGIESVSAAISLREDFRNYVEESTKLLKKKCFVIAFDDIDVDFKKGWPVLETIRKYFTSSKIISLLSGDLKFYSLAIRKQHWMNFGKPLLMNEAVTDDQKKYYHGLVTEMESQYMLKVLKPERRLHLTTLYEKIILSKSLQRQGKEDRLKIMVGNTNQKSIELISFYSHLFQNFGILNHYQAEAYYSYLLRLPLRTQIQFLSQLNPNTFRGQKGILIDAFLSDLFEKKVNIHVLESVPVLLNGEILSLLLREQALNDGYQFQPITQDSSLNGCLMAFSLLSSQNYSNSAYHLFDYFIKIGFIRNLASSLKYADKQKQFSAYSAPSIDGLVWHSGLLQDRILRDSVGHINAYLHAGISSSNKWAGMIPILSLEEKAKEGGRRSFDRIDFVFRDQGIKSIIAFMPISISSHMSKNSSEVSYSVFTLLAAIGECIRKAEMLDLNKGLSELSQIRTFPIPDFERNQAEASEGYSFGEAFNSTFPENAEVLEKIIHQWVFAYPKGNFSTHMLGKVITRFFYALKSIEDSETADSLGEMMHRRIVAFFNALIIEEAREGVGNFSGININNTNFHDKIFTGNVRAAMMREEKLQLSNWFLSCPLLLPFLNPKSAAYRFIREFVPAVQKIPHFDLNIFDLLTRVSFKGKRLENEVTTNFTRDDIVSILRKNRIPYSLFRESPSRAKTRENNETIRRVMSDLLNQSDWTSTKIREFKRYLKREYIKW